MAFNMIPVGIPEDFGARPGFRESLGLAVVSGDLEHSHLGGWRKAARRRRRRGSGKWQQLEIRVGNDAPLQIQANPQSAS